MDESEKRIAPFGLRLPPELKGRVQNAATDGNQSMNALIVSVLEREFPQPSINLHELAAFLSGLSSEMLDGDGDGSYLQTVNEGLATAKTPWFAAYEDGMIKFYPYADAASLRRLVEKDGGGG